MKVSCVMPSRGDPNFLRAAIDCYLKQTYEDKELLIGLDGPDHPMVSFDICNNIHFYYTQVEHMNLGQKRNWLNDMTKGDLICHFDDDDWSCPTRLQTQVDELLNSTCSIVGQKNMIYYYTTNKTYHYYTGWIKDFVLANSIMYRKGLWKITPFPEIQTAQVSQWLLHLHVTIFQSNHNDLVISRIHLDNNASKITILPCIYKGIIPDEFVQNEQLRLAVLNNNNQPSNKEENV